MYFGGIVMSPPCGGVCAFLSELRKNKLLNSKAALVDLERVAGCEGWLPVDAGRLIRRCEVYWTRVMKQLAVFVSGRHLLFL